MIRLASLILIACGAFPLAFGQSGQLYLIVGTEARTNSPSYQTVLVSVGLEGSIKVEKEFTSAKSGTEWITTSYDARKALILSNEPDNLAIVLDLDTTSVTKSCRDPDGSLLIGRWLTDSPSRGLMFVGLGNNPSTEQVEFLGIQLDSPVPCEKSFIKVNAEEVNYFVGDGTAGIADVRSYNPMYVILSSDGTLSAKWLTGEQTYPAYQVPTRLFADMKQPPAAIILNNRQIFGLSLGAPTTRFLVFRKSDNTWHQVPGASDASRAFGSMITSVEGHAKSSSIMQESAGKAEWRIAETPTGPATARMFQHSRVVYPGILHLYNAATETSYTITTNQGDSEILLVENGKVYYRVSDRLYSAPIGETSIGRATLLATGELIRDAHWAFIKR